MNVQCAKHVRKPSHDHICLRVRIGVGAIEGLGVGAPVGEGEGNSVGTGVGTFVGTGVGAYQECHIQTQCHWH